MSNELERYEKFTSDISDEQLNGITGEQVFKKCFENLNIQEMFTNRHLISAMRLLKVKNDPDKMEKKAVMEYNSLDNKLDNGIEVLDLMNEIGYDTSSQNYEIYNNSLFWQKISYMEKWSFLYYGLENLGLLDIPDDVQQQILDDY